MALSKPKGTKRPSSPIQRAYFEGMSANPDQLQDITFGAHLEYPDGSIPVLHKASSGRMSPIRAKTMKEYDKQIAELKKENFSLKLRIYFLEERMQQKFGSDGEEVYKTNIELKVEVESLKKELMDKQELLMKASNALESIENQHETEIQQMREVARLEFEKEALQTKTKETEESLNCNILEEKSRIIDQLKDALQEKDKRLEVLELERREGFPEIRRPLEIQIEQLQNEISSKTKYLESHENKLQKERENDEDNLQKLKEKVDETVIMYETSKRDLENKVKKIQDMEKRIKEFEKEKKKSSENALKRDKTIQGLIKSVHAKEKEIEKFQEQLENQQEEVNRLTSQLQQFNKEKKQEEEKDSILAEKDGNQLREKDLENKHLKQVLKKKDKEMQNLKVDKEMAEEVAQAARNEMDVAIQNLRDQLADERQRSNDKVENAEKQYQNLVEDYERQLRNKEKIIQRLTLSLQEKDCLVEEYINTLHDDNKTKKNEEKNIFTLKGKERVKAFEELIEEKQKLIDEKDAQLGQLKQDIKEKVRDFEKSRQLIQSLEENIRRLEAETSECKLSLQQNQAALKASQRQLQDLTENYSRIIEEKDRIIAWLQNSLSNTEKKLKDVTEMEVDNTRETNINLLLKEKEKLLQEVITERNNAAKENDRIVQKLMSNIDDKEDTIKNIHDKHNREIAAKNQEIQKLLSELSRKELELQSFENRIHWSEKEHQGFLEKMNVALQEKDKTIEALVESGRDKDRLFRQMLSSNFRIEEASYQVEVGELKSEILHLQNQMQNKEGIIEQLRTVLRHLKQSSQTTSSSLEINYLEQEKSDFNVESLHEIIKSVINGLQQKVDLLYSENQTDVNMEQIGSILSNLISAFKVLSDTTTAERQAYIQDSSAERNSEYESVMHELHKLRQQLLQNISCTSSLKNKLEKTPTDLSQGNKKENSFIESAEFDQSQESNSEGILLQSSSLSVTDSSLLQETILALQKQLESLQKQLLATSGNINLCSRDGNLDRVMKNTCFPLTISHSEELGNLQQTVNLVQQQLEVLKQEIRDDRHWDITLQPCYKSSQETITNVYNELEVNELKEELVFLQQEIIKLRQQLQESKKCSITLETRRCQDATIIDSSTEHQGSQNEEESQEKYPKISGYSNPSTESKDYSDYESNFVTISKTDVGNCPSKHFVSALAFNKLKSSNLVTEKCPVSYKTQLSSNEIKLKLTPKIIPCSLLEDELIKQSSLEQVNAPQEWHNNIDTLEVSVKCTNKLKGLSNRPLTSTLIFDSDRDLPVSRKEVSADHNFETYSQLANSSIELSDFHLEMLYPKCGNIGNSINLTNAEALKKLQYFEKLLLNQDNEIVALKQQLQPKIDVQETEFVSNLMMKLKNLEYQLEEKNQKNKELEKEAVRMDKKKIISGNPNENEALSKKASLINEQHVTDLIQELDRLKLQLIEKERQNDSLKHQLEEYLSELSNPNMFQEYNDLKRKFEETEYNNKLLRFELLHSWSFEDISKATNGVEKEQLAKGLADKIRELQILLNKTKLSSKSSVLQNSNSQIIESISSHEQINVDISQKLKNSSNIHGTRLRKFTSGSLNDLREIKSCPCNVGNSLGSRNSDIVIKELSSDDNKIGFSISDVVTELQKQVEKFRNLWQQSESMNIILKQQMELSSKSTMEENLNPHLLVNMTREIEHLKTELFEAQKKIKESGHQSHIWEFSKPENVFKKCSNDYQQLFHSSNSFGSEKNLSSDIVSNRYSSQDYIKHSVDNALMSQRSQSETNIANVGLKYCFNSSDNICQIDESLREGFPYLRQNELHRQKKFEETLRLQQQVDDLRQQAKINQQVIDFVCSNSETENISFVVPTKLDKFHKDTLDASSFESIDSENNILQTSVMRQSFQEDFTSTVLCDLPQTKEITILKKRLFNFQNLCETLHLRLEELFIFLEQLLHFDENGQLDTSLLTPQKLAALKRFLTQSRELSFSLSETLNFTAGENTLQNLSETSICVQESKHPQHWTIEDRKSPKGMESQTTLHQEISQLKKELHERQQLNLKLKELLNENQQVSTLRIQEMDKLLKQAIEKDKLIIKLQQKIKSLQLQLRQLSGKSVLVNYARLERQSLSDNRDTDGESQKSFDQKRKLNSPTMHNKSIETLDDSSDFVIKKPPLKPVQPTARYGSRENYLQTGDMLEDFDLPEKQGQQIFDPSSLGTSILTASRATSGKSLNLDNLIKEHLVEKRDSLCDFVRRKEMRSPSSQRSDAGHCLDSGISSQRSRVSPKSPPSIDEPVINDRRRRSSTGKVNKDLPSQNLSYTTSSVQSINHSLISKAAALAINQDSLSESDQWSAPDRSESLRRLGIDLRVSMIEKSIPQGQSSESLISSDGNSGHARMSSSHAYSRKKRIFYAELMEMRRLEAKIEDLEQVNLSLHAELNLLRNVKSSSVAAQTSLNCGRNPAEILETHLNEIRALRIRLEESIQNNDRLREQLEQRLANSDPENDHGLTDGHSGTNIFVRGTRQNAEIDLLRRQLAERDRANHERQDAISRVLEEHTTQQEENVQLKESKYQLELINHKLSLANNELQSKVVKLEENQKSLETLKAHFELTTHQLEVGNRAVLQDNQQHHITNKTLKHQNNQLEETNQALEETNKMLEQTNKVLEDRNQSLQMSNTSIEEVNHSSQKAYKNLEDMYRQLQSSCRQHPGQIENLNKENKMLQDAVNRLQKEIGHTQKENRRSQEETDNLKKQIKENTELVTNLKKELSIYEKLHKSLNDIVNYSSGDTVLNAQDLTCLISDIRNILQHLEQNIDLSTTFRKKMEERFEAMEMTKPSSIPITHIHHHHHSSVPSINTTQIITEPKIKSPLIEDVHQKISGAFDKENHVSKSVYQFDEKCRQQSHKTVTKNRKDHHFSHSFPLSTKNEYTDIPIRRHSLQTSDDINLLEYHQVNYLPSLRRSSSSDRLAGTHFKNPKQHSINTNPFARDMLNQEITNSSDSRQHSDTVTINDLQTEYHNSKSHYYKVHSSQSTKTDSGSVETLNKADISQSSGYLDLNIETDMKKFLQHPNASYLTSTSSENIPHTILKGNAIQNSKPVYDVTNTLISKDFWNEIDSQAWKNIQSEPTLRSYLRHENPIFKSNLSSRSNPHDTLRLDDLRTDLHTDPLSRSLGNIGYNINDPYPPLSPPHVRVDSDNRLLYAVGRIDDYELLKKEIGEGLVILKGMEARIRDRSLTYKHGSPGKSLEQSTIKELGSSTNNLQMYLNECYRLIRLFWTTMLPSKGETVDHTQERNIKEENENLKEEVKTLKRRIARMEKVLRKAVGKLEATNRMKEGMEKAIVKQLSKTHDVLKRARGNLQDNKKTDETSKQPKCGT